MCCAVPVHPPPLGDPARSPPAPRRPGPPVQMDHQVLRHKVAEMARGVESCHAMLEQIAYQFKAGVADEHLAGMIALTKVHATKTYDLCAREATQIMGGAACVRGGPGEKVERLYREVRINAIGGGSEEILMDRQCSTQRQRQAGTGREQGWMRRAAPTTSAVDSCPTIMALTSSILYSVRALSHARVNVRVCVQWPCARRSSNAAERSRPRSTPLDAHRPCRIPLVPATCTDMLDSLASACPAPLVKHVNVQTFLLTHTRKKINQLTFEISSV